MQDADYEVDAASSLWDADVCRVSVRTYSGGVSEFARALRAHKPELSSYSILPLLYLTQGQLDTLVTLFKFWRKYASALFYTHHSQLQPKGCMVLYLNKLHMVDTLWDTSGQVMLASAPNSNSSALHGQPVSISDVSKVSLSDLGLEEVGRLCATYDQEVALDRAQHVTWEQVHRAYILRARLHTAMSDIQQAAHTQSDSAALQALAQTTLSYVLQPPSQEESHYMEHVYRACACSGASGPRMHLGSGHTDESSLQRLCGPLQQLSAASRPAAGVAGSSPLGTFSQAARTIGAPVQMTACTCVPNSLAMTQCFEPRHQSTATEPPGTGDADHQCDRASSRAGRFGSKRGDGGSTGQQPGEERQMRRSGSGNRSRSRSRRRSRSRKAHKDSRRGRSRSTEDVRRSSGSGRARQRSRSRSKSPRSSHLPPAPPVGDDEILKTMSMLEIKLATALSQAGPMGIPFSQLQAQYDFHVPQALLTGYHSQWDWVVNRKGLCKWHVDRLMMWAGSAGPVYGQTFYSRAKRKAYTHVRMAELSICWWLQLHGPHSVAYIQIHVPINKIVLEATGSLAEFLRNRPSLFEEDPRLRRVAVRPGWRQAMGLPPALPTSLKKRDL